MILPRARGEDPHAAALDAALSISAGGTPTYTASYDSTGDMACRAPTSATTCTGSTPTGAALTYSNERWLTHWQNAQTNPTVTDDFRYDGEGHRIAQSGDGVTTYYVGGLEEVANGVLTKYYHIPGVLTAVRVSGALSYLAADGLSSVTEALDGNGNITAAQLYTPYGATRYSSGSMPTSKAFTDQRADAATGLDYYGARYYDPSLGQFTSADTASDSLNHYGYVAGNPATFTDPTGHKLWAGGDSGGGGGSGPGKGGSSSGGGHGGGQNDGGFWGGVLNIGGQVLDATTGIPSMIHDVQTIFSGDASTGDKLWAGADLIFNVAMDVTMVIGVGEGLRAFYLGGKIAEHVGEEALERGGEDALEHLAGCGGGLSFAANTLVAVPGGKRAIASLKVGDKVTAYDPKTGKTSTQTVEATYLNHDTDLLDVTLRVSASSSSASSSATATAPAATKPASNMSKTTHDEMIHTTANHPWLTADHGWLVAGKLHVGEPVQEADGSVALVEAVRVVPGAASMWDLTVSNIHTFAVGDGAFVVHNNSCSVNTAKAKGLLKALANSNADVSHAVVAVGEHADGSTLVSLNERVANKGVTDLTDQTAQKLQEILTQGNWANQGMTYVGPDMLQPAGTAFDSLIHAEPYLVNSGVDADTVGVSKVTGPCPDCMKLLGRT